MKYKCYDFSQEWRNNRISQIGVQSPKCKSMFFHQSQKCHQFYFFIALTARPVVNFTNIFMTSFFAEKLYRRELKVQVDLVICGLFICEFAYLRLWIDHIFGTYPPIYSHSWSFFMRIRYMPDKFFGPYLSHITRSTCINNSFTAEVN